MPIVYDFSNNFDPAAIVNPIVLDTNVIVDWYYDQNGLVNNDSRQRSLPYRSAIQSCISNGNKLIITTHILFEMFHVFCRYDKEIYEQMHALKKGTLGLKSFRTIPSEQANRATRYPLILSQIKSSHVEITDTLINVDMLGEYCSDIGSNCMDGNDYILTKHAISSDYTLLTNDADFICLHPQCDIATINPNALSAALQDGYTRVAM